MFALPYRLWNHFQTDSLFRNSIYLMASTGVMAVLGFFFWIFVARLFSTHDVGIATTLISAVSLISSLSLLGFNLSLIRYLPVSDSKNEKINSSLLLIIITSIVVSVVFLFGLKLFSPSLLFLQSSIWYAVSFTFFAIILSFNTIIESVFIAHRSSGNILAKNVVYSVIKLVAPLLLVGLGAYGIFSSASIALFVSSVMGFVILFLKYSYKPSFNFNKDVVKEMAVFSGGNYLSGFLSQVPSLVLPLLIINLLNAEAAAYYYVSSMIANFLSIVSQATTQSLLAEGSHDESRIQSHFIKSLGIIFLFLVPAITIIVLFGNLILHAFGKSYATEAFTFLRIVAVIPFFSAISSLGNSLLRLRHKITYLVLLNFINAVITLGVLYFFIPHGLVSIGWGMLLAQVIVTTLYTLFFLRKKLV